MQSVTGYLHATYAQSLMEFGSPLELPYCHGWILQRPIPGFPDHDGLGSYPIFACQDWFKLHVDLEELGKELVSLSLVTDPFGTYDLSNLRRVFEDVMVPFKQHFIVDLCRPMTALVSEHHNRYARRALRDVCVEECVPPIQYLDDWVDLYADLIERHQIKGIAAFSRECFTKQLEVPGLVAFRAVHEGITVGMLLWYVQGEVGYYHLGAYNALGYALRASFALFWVAIEYFKDQGLRWLNLGAGAGLGGEGSDGLTRFKRGWSTGTRTAYFCGRVLDHGKYSELVQTTGVSAKNYFPAYRAGEFR